MSVQGKLDASGTVGLSWQSLDEQERYEVWSYFVNTYPEDKLDYVPFCDMCDELAEWTSR